ncbi:MAG: HAD-IIIA family hydrolase [Bacteroidota bacterium]
MERSEESDAVFIPLTIDARWTLFLDRDGVINQRLPGAYVKDWQAFQFCPGSLAALVDLSAIFSRIIVVTNQQGVGKGLMSAAQVEAIHQQLTTVVQVNGGRIDAIYYCPELASQQSQCRKPHPVMAWQAQRDFPAIDFQHSLMVGDSISDMEFAFGLGMKTVFIKGKTEEAIRSQDLSVDYRLNSLSELRNCLSFSPLS